MTFVSYAQNYEDVMLARAFRGIAVGFYIDVGAQDPRLDSVTKAFYDLGWRGMNVEPVPEWHEKLCRDRPRDINVRVAAGASEGEVELHEIAGSGLSTASSEFAERHRRDGLAMTTRQVPMRTLDALCAEHGVREVHFLKIDVEGAEGEVLRGIDFSVLRPWVVLVEATEPNSQVGTHGQWESLLTGHGYRFVYHDGLNRFYLADEHAALGAAFATPPNVFDGFVRREFVDHDAELNRRMADIDALSHRRAGEIDRLVATIGGKDEQLSELFDHQARAQATLAALRQQLAAQQAELQRFAEHHVVDLAALRELQASHLQLQADHLRLQAEYSQLQAEHSQLQAEHSRLQAAHSQLQAGHSQLQDAGRELQVRLGDEQDRAAALAARLERSERAGTRLSRALLDAQSAQHASAAAWAASVAVQERTLSALVELQREHDIMLASRSWKLTAPLRRANAAGANVLQRAAALARTLARRPWARRLAAAALAPFPGLARRVKARLYGPPASAEAKSAASATPAQRLPLSEDAEAILARCPVRDTPTPSDASH